GTRAAPQPAEPGGQEGPAAAGRGGHGRGRGPAPPDHGAARGSGLRVQGAGVPVLRQPGRPVARALQAGERRPTTRRPGGRLRHVRGTPAGRHAAVLRRRGAPGPALPPHRRREVGGGGGRGVPKEHSFRGAALLGRPARGRGTRRGGGEGVRLHVPGCGGGRRRPGRTGSGGAERRRGAVLPGDACCVRGGAWRERWV
ncbi:MAG: hypothetical protein AVDCRST_MAG50-162, partial [uncultured Acidimicrobiales bacterium]